MVSFKNSDVEVQPPNKTAFGDGDIMEVELNEVIRVGP